MMLSLFTLTICCGNLNSFLVTKFYTGTNDFALNAYSNSGGKFGGGNRGGGWRGGVAGGRGGGSRSPPDIPIRFTKTIKIDPDLKTPLADMPMSDKTKKVLELKGFETMTPIQSQSYDLVYSGVDVVARSRTGTGKTFAFGLPLIEKILAMDENDRRSGGLPLVLILEPTRELAIQVAQELSSVCAAHRIWVEAMYGGSSFYTQEKALRKGVHILVATPGRALDHISRGTVDLSNTRHVVLDEGDTMLEMGFQKDVESILANVKLPGEKSRKASMKLLASEGMGRIDAPEDDDADEDFDDLLGAADDDDFQSFAAKAQSTRATSNNAERDVQMLLFSATMPGWICKLTDKHMKAPVFLDAVQEGETRLSASIKHYSIRLPQGLTKVEAVSNFAEDLILTKGAGGQTIVFTNTKEEADTLFGSECFGNMRTQVLHGDISQNTRQTTIKQFREGQIEVLIATDVAARGLDIAGVDLVLHTAPPNDHDTYVHRSGRTGRAGRNGTSICMHSSSEESKLRMFENSLNFKFERSGPPSLKEVSEASAVLAAKKLSSVNKNVVKYMLPHARILLSEIQHEIQDTHSASSEKPASSDSGSDESAIDSDGDLASHADAPNVAKIDVEQKYELLLAKCLAAMANRKSISSRSLQTGESGVLTLQVEAVYKNGSSPDSVRDWQRLFTGVLKRSLSIEEVQMGKVCLARTDTRLPCALVDVPEEEGQIILEALDRTKLPQGLSIKECEVLPFVVPDFASGGGSRYASAGKYGTGGGGYRGSGGARGGYSGGSGYSGGGGGGYSGGGRSYSPQSRPGSGSNAEKSWSRGGDSGSRGVGGSSWRSPSGGDKEGGGGGGYERKSYTPSGRSYSPN